MFTCVFARSPAPLTEDVGPSEAVANLPEAESALRTQTSLTDSTLDKLISAALAPSDFKAISPIFQVGVFLFVCPLKRVGTKKSMPETKRVAQNT